MIDGDKLETILQRRFPGASLDQIAAAANAIIGLDCQVAGDRCGDGDGAGCARKKAEARMALRLPSAAP